MTKDYDITIVVRNNRLLEAMRAAGHQTAASLSRACGVSMVSIGEYLRFKRTPILRHGERWSSQILRIAEHLRCLPEDLFPVAHVREAMACSKVSFTADAPDIHQISASLRSAALPPDEKMMISESTGSIDKLLRCLSPREERVLRIRFGLGAEDEQTLQAVGDEWNLTKDRIRQIEAKAILKLQRKLRNDSSLEDEFGRRVPRSVRETYRSAAQ